MKDFLMHLALLFGRVSLGGYFAIAGYNKLAGPGPSGFAKFAMERAPDWNAPLVSTYLHALPFAELIIGSMLVLGILPRVATVLMLPMLASFLMAVRDPIHIVGVAGTGGAPFDKNFLLVPFALILTVMGGGKIAMGSLVGSMLSKLLGRKTKATEIMTPKSAIGPISR
jgi:uncharacterized membrane protein YphA (DoxX/SURF4 family)